MDTDHSSIEWPILPRRNFAGTINKRYVKDTVTTIELVDDFWSAPRQHGSYQIKDVNTGNVLFQVLPLSENDKYCQGTVGSRLLLDAYGAPVIKMERTDKAPVSSEYVVIPGGESSTDPFCAFQIHIQNIDPLFEMFFPLPNSPLRVRISTFGRWAGREVVITTTTREYIREVDEFFDNRSTAEFAVGMAVGPGADTETLARIYPHGNILDGVYRMDIAPGVDTALIVLIAAAMDEQTRKHPCELDEKVR